ncbi:location of vulva defective 1-like [Parasteatoda tepidariorum]
MRSEDGSFELSSKENVLSHDFPEVGEWNVSFVAKDSDVNEQSNQISKQLRILSEVSNYVYNASATEGEIDESIEFTISLSEFDDYSCVVFDAADNSRLRAFGNEEVCTLHYDKEDFKFIEKPTDFARRKREIKDAMWKDESTISILNNYMYGGKFQPSVDVFNSVSRLKKNLTIFISYGDYDTPVLWIDENSTDSDRPIECKRGIDCRYETTAIFRNNQSYLAYHEWSIFKLDGTGNEDEIDISYLKTHNCSAIRILKRSLELGLYKLKYTLTIYAEDENVTHEEDLHTVKEIDAYEDYRTYVQNRSILTRRSVYSYLRIIETPLLPMLVRGGATHIRRGYGQTVHLEPTIYTEDPDNPDERNFNVTWFCLRYDQKESLTELGAHEYDTSNPSSPITDRSTVKEKDNKGGCFGKGPGLMKVASSDFELDTASFWSHDAVYELIAVIKKNHKITEGHLFVEVVKGKPPSLQVMCEKRVACIPDVHGVYINPSSYIPLRVECIEDCGDTKINYEWNIYATDLKATEKSPLENVEQHMRVDYDRVGVNQTLFLEHSDVPAFLVRAKGTLMNETVSEGISSILLVINHPPSKGKCKISEKSGFALIDLFHVKFSDWTDEDGHEIADYSVYLKYDDVYMRLSYGKKEKVEVVLPYGTHEIWCTVEDSIGAVTWYGISNFTTSLPTEEQLDEYEKSRFNDKCIGEGRMTLVSQIVIAKNSVVMEHRRRQNKSDVFDGVSEREIGTHWQEHLELEGIDSSYYTPQAKEEIREMLTENLEKEMNHEAIEKSRELSKILRVPMEALPDVEIFGGALSSVAENGPTDLHGKMKIMKGMENMYEIINQTEVPHPEAKKIAIGQLGSLADTVAGSLADSNIGGNFLPFELNQAEEDLNHNATEPNYFIYYVEGNRKEVEDRLRNRAVDEAKGNQLNDAKEMVSKIKTMISEIQEYCMEEIMAGPDPFYTTTRNGFQMTFYKDFATNLSNENIQQGDSSITLPNICKTLDQNDCDDNQLIVGIQAVRWTQPLESHSENSAILNEKSNVIQIDITSREGNSTIPVNNTGDPFIICIPVSKDNDPNNGMEFIVPRFSSNEDIFVYHTVFVDSSGVGVTVNLKPDNNSESLIVIYKYGDYPSLHDYDGLTRLDDIPIVDGIHSLFIGSDVIKESGKNLTVGIGQISNTTDVKVVFENPEEHNLTEANMTNQFSSNYSIKVATTGCYYFSDLEERWSTNGCQVVSSLSTVTCCACNHLTSFGSGFFIAPNKIDFSYVFSHAGFSNNVTIYATIIVIFSSFILFLIFARWKDRKDLEKLGATPLSDNEVGDKYIYEILVYTGNQRNSGTKSNVFFLVSGDDDETSVRHLSDDKRPVLQKGSIDVFVMATPRSLGQLNYLRIWHDNTGTGKWSSWFCRYIIFRDVQTGLKYEFIINKWLAVEYDDGMIDRLIPVSGKEQVTEFSSLFSTASQRNLADNHLWLSIFLRPTRSRFTRVQRVCCCTAVLCLSMLTNAMYYERTSAKPDQGGFKFGPLSLSPEQIAVGVLSNLMIFPPTFLMIFFFRKSRPKNLRPSRIEEAVKQQRSEWKKKPSANKERKNKKSDAEAQTCHRKKRFSLPWWCVYFGWFMVAISIGASLFFMWAYGIEFGDEKTSKWLTSLVVSFFSSLLVTQPIKIILMTIVMSCICRSANYEDDDADDDEEDPYLKSDEEYLHEGQKKKRLTYQPMDTTALEEARKEREKEVKMHSMIREILTYFFFLWVITILSYGNRDPSNFYLREALINGFIKPGDIYTDFNFVNTERRFWNWTYNALLPELFAANWYNGRSPLGLRLFLDDRNNLKIGYAVLRQVRIHPRSCNVHWLMQSITPECAGYGGMVHEDGTLYTKGWIEVNSTETLVPPEYKYLTASQLKGYPFWGQIDWYGGGGYVVPLIAKRDSDIDSLRQRLYKIERDGWIDKYTRAIFVEFGVYNAQINLFCAVTILAEFLPGGGVVPYYHIDPLRLLNYHTGFGLIQLAVEILFVIFTVFFTYKEVSSMIQQGLAYFKQYWNNAEVVSIVVSYTGIANHIYKLFATAEILRIFTETDGTGYIKLQEAVLLNELFCYQIGLVMSISTLKFLKLLRFNKRIGILSSALRICGQELQSYAVCLMIVFMAFVILFWLLLGRFVREFSTFVYSFESSISMMLKKFNYEDMYAAQPVFTPIAFFTFSLATSLVLINILLSIIIRSFEDVKHDVNLQSDEYEVLDFFINRIKMMLGIGTAKVRPMPNLHGEKIKPLDSISTFPAKVDRLVDFINDFYFDSQMDFNSKEFLKKMNADTTMINKGGKRNARPVLKSKIPKSVSEQFDDF